MSISILHANLGSRTIWYSGVALIFSAILISLYWQPSSQRLFPTTVPLEDVLWTATPDYNIFFGPGTPPSAELSARLRALEKNYGVPKTAYRFPNVPLFISPRIFMSDESKNEIVIYSPLTPDAITFVHSDSLRSRQTTNR